MHTFKQKNPLKYTESEEERLKKLIGKKHHAEHERKESRKKERKEHLVYY